MAGVCLVIRVTVTGRESALPLRFDGLVGGLTGLCYWLFAIELREGEVYPLHHKVLIDRRETAF